MTKHTWAHPHSRGENRPMTDEEIDRGGSSPLTRGKHAARAERLGRRGLIPTHAGKTGTASSRSSKPRAHPHSRGENESVAYGIPPMLGSSPLTRGKPRRLGPWWRPSRLIPTHAGKTAEGHASHQTSPAHPHSRGENQAAADARTDDTGSSPLTRGKLQSRECSRRWCGLIPTHAGKTVPDLHFYCSDRSDLGKP